MFTKIFCKILWQKTRLSLPKTNIFRNIKYFSKKNDITLDIVLLSSYNDNSKVQYRVIEKLIGEGQKKKYIGYVLKLNPGAGRANGEAKVKNFVATSNIYALGLLGKGRYVFMLVPVLGWSRLNQWTKRQLDTRSVYWS